MPVPGATPAPRRPPTEGRGGAFSWWPSAPASGMGRGGVGRGRAACRAGTPARPRAARDPPPIYVFRLAPPSTPHNQANTMPNPYPEPRTMPHSRRPPLPRATRTPLSCSLPSSPQPETSLYPPTQAPPWPILAHPPCASASLASLAPSPPCRDTPFLPRTPTEVSPHHSKITVIYRKTHVIIPLSIPNQVLSPAPFAALSFSYPASSSPDANTSTFMSRFDTCKPATLH